MSYFSRYYPLGYNDQMTKPDLILASASLGRKTLLEKLGVPFTVMPSTIDEDAIIDTDLYRMLEARAEAKAKDVAEKLSAISHQPSDQKNSPSPSLKKREIPSLLNKRSGGVLSTNYELPTMNYLIIAADSMAILDGKVYGKSKDKAHSRQIVEALNGRTHEFVTATHIIYLSDVTPTSTSVIPMKIGIQMPPTQRLRLTDEENLSSQTLDSRFRGNDNVKTSKIWSNLSISHVTTRKMSEFEIDSYVNRYDFTRFAAAYTLNETPWNWITKVEGSYTGVIGLPFEVILPIFKKMKIL